MKERLVLEMILRVEQLEDRCQLGVLLPVSIEVAMLGQTMHFVEPLTGRPVRYIDYDVVDTTALAAAKVEADAIPQELWDRLAAKHYVAYLVKGPGVTDLPLFRYLSGAVAPNGMPYDAVGGCTSYQVSAVVEPETYLGSLVYEVGHGINFSLGPNGLYSSQQAWQSLWGTADWSGFGSNSWFFQAYADEAWAESFRDYVLGLPIVNSAVGNYFASLGL